MFYSFSSFDSSKGEFAVSGASPMLASKTSNSLLIGYSEDFISSGFDSEDFSILMVSSTCNDGFSASIV